MSKNKYTPYAAKPKTSKPSSKLLNPKSGYNPIYTPPGSISWPNGMIGDYDGDIDFLVAGPPLKDLPELGKNFEIIETKGVYYLVEHKVLSIRKWVLDTAITSEGIKNAFYDADQFFDPPE